MAHAFGISRETVYQDLRYWYAKRMSIQDTAYPRLKTTVTRGELQQVWTPTLEEQRWVRSHVHQNEDRSQVHTQEGPRVMAVLCNTAIGLLRYLKLPNISRAVTHLDRRPNTSPPSRTLIDRPLSQYWFAVILAHISLCLDFAPRIKCQFHGNSSAG